MALDTSTRIRNLVIYSVYVRNHTPEGSFRAVIADLPRIRALGADVVWLMPIHPIGEVARKGTLGSPYANRDYRTVNPELGTLDDFAALVDAIHANDMRCMIDVVYNHTSPDSVLWETHPEWFYKRADGTPGNHVGDWTDIIDLDYANAALWDYQIETLRYWAQWVDGFRCDVASFVPVEFWKRARAAVEEVRPGCLWLAESVHRSFGQICRRLGMTCARDTELFEAFDIEYEYDVREAFERYLRGEIPLSCYLDLLDFEDATYPANYDKLRFLENHDVPRIAGLAGERWSLENLTAFSFFGKGTTLLYAGQERATTHLPSLFDKDPIDWAGGRDLSPLISRLAQIKKDVLDADDDISYAADDAMQIALVNRWGAGTHKVGVFSLAGRAASVAVNVPDGSYENLIDGRPVQVTDGRLATGGQPVIISLPE